MGKSVRFWDFLKYQLISSTKHWAQIHNQSANISTVICKILHKIKEHWHRKENRGSESICGFLKIHVIVKIERKKKKI